MRNVKDSLEMHTMHKETERLLTQKSSPPLFVYACALLACMSSLNTGYDIGIIASAIIYIQQDLGISNVQVELMIASANFFAIIGSIIGGHFAHEFGRKPIIITSAIISCIAVLLMASTFSFYIILLSRCMNGLSIGMSLLITPLYIAELAPKNIRGKIVTYNEIFINIGHILGYSMALLFYYLNVSASMSWRIMVASGALISFLLFISMLCMPESPRWLIQRGHDSKAKHILSKTENSTSEDVIDRLILDMHETNEILAEDTNSGWKQIMLPCIFKPDLALQKSLTIGVAVAMFSQLCGIETFVYYTPKILEQNGLNDANIFIGTIGIGLSKLVFLMIAQYFMDRVGRKPLLIISAFSMSLCIGALGALVQFEDDIQQSNVLIMVVLVLITGTFSIGYGPVTWLLNSEIFALNVRSKAMAYCTFLNRLSATIITLTFFSLQTLITDFGVYYLYAGIGFIAGWFIVFKVPETKSKSLEDITRMLLKYV